MQLLGASDQEQLKEVKSRKNFYRVWTIIGLGVIVFALGYVLNTLAMPISVIIWTGIIVFCLRTPVNRLERLGVHRALGTTIAFIGGIVLVAALAALLFSPVFGVSEQFNNLIQNVPIYFQQVVDWYDQLHSSSYFSFLQNDFTRNLANEALSAVTTWASQMAKNSADTLVAVGSSIFNFFVVIGFALVVSFWILMELPAIGKECRRLIAGKHAQDAEMLYVTFTRVISGFIKATLLQCLFIGLGCGIAFAIIGIPNAAALGGIAGLLNIIPVVGPWLGGALAGIVGIFISPIAALIALIATIVIQQFIYTIVSPKLMADSVDVHPALVILAMLVGMAIGGAMNGLMGSLVGMLASIPAAAAIKAIFVYYFEKNTGRQIVAEDGVFFKGTPSHFEDSEINPIADATSPSRPEPVPAAAGSRREKGFWSTPRKKGGKRPQGGAGGQGAQSGQQQGRKPDQDSGQRPGKQSGRQQGRQGNQQKKP